MKPTPTSDTLDQPTLAEPEAPSQLQTASARRRYDAWFALGMLALGAITLYLLSQGGAVLQRPTARQTGTIANIDVRTPQPVAQPLPPGVVAAHTREYVFSQPNIGLMQPSVDAQGNIWFGEMGANRLARLDPHTNHVSTWQPPNGRYNIMSTAVDAQGNVWFAEQAANYIGKFDPATQHFTTYPLEVSNGRIAAPQDLQFDQAGMLWFTEINSVKIGRLDPTTGAIHLYPLPTPDAQVFSTAADSQGRIWFTELQDGKLGMVDSKTGAVVEKPVPQTLGRAAGLYDVVTDAGGNVWFACASVDALVRYTPQTDGFTFYQLATPNSTPYGLTLDANGALWFTADASPSNYVGILLP
ncbi:MAG: Vgb family protein [Ktedonobacterales bacterium]